MRRCVAADSVACELKLEDVGETAFESEIELITGKTHQILAELAAEGFLVCDDTKYENVVGRLLADHIDTIELRPDPELLGLSSIPR